MQISWAAKMLPQTRNSITLFQFQLQLQLESELKLDLALQLASHTIFQLFSNCQALNRASIEVGAAARKLKLRWRLKLALKSELELKLGWLWLSLIALHTKWINVIWGRKKMLARALCQLTVARKQCWQVSLFSGVFIGVYKDFLGKTKLKVLMSLKKGSMKKGHIWILNDYNRV